VYIPWYFNTKHRLQNTIRGAPCALIVAIFYVYQPVVAGATLFGTSLAHADTNARTATTEPTGSDSTLRRMTDSVVPITLEERKGRIEKAQELMRDNRIDAIYLEPGSSMSYYTGMRWGTSERMFAAVIPARGELAWVCPKFEEERARELIKMGTDIRTWEEDESPYNASPRSFAIAACAPEQSALKNACVSSCTTAFEGRAGAEVRRRDPDHRRLPHDQVTAEISLMQKGKRHHDRSLQSHARQHD
jgi:hypothetical protein